MKNIKWNQVGFYATMGVLTLTFGTSGIGKLISMADWLIEWELYDYPLWFMYAIGIVQVIGTVALWIPKTRFWAAALFVAIMIGAAYTHIAVGQYLEIIQNVVMVALCVVVMRISERSLLFKRAEVKYG